MRVSLKGYLQDPNQPRGGEGSNCRPGEKVLGETEGVEGKAFYIIIGDRAVSDDMILKRIPGCDAGVRGIYNRLVEREPLLLE